MRAEGFGRPSPYWDAHAVVAGGDTRAWQLRALLAEDDTHNGCWLPSRSKYCGQQPYRNAVPHSRIHRYNYFAWLNMRFAGVFDEKTVRHRLLMTRRDLLHATFPKEVMLPKGKWNEPCDNLSNTYHEAFVDFVLMRKQLDRLKVWGCLLIVNIGWYCVN